jgi:hypothetical protein
MDDIREVLDASGTCVHAVGVPSCSFVRLLCCTLQIVESLASHSNGDSVYFLQLLPLKRQLELGRDAWMVLICVVRALF